MSPSALLEETNFYFTVKRIISRAHSDVDSFKKKNKEKRRGR